MIILYSVLVLGIVALFFGALIAVLSKKLAVKEDPLIGSVNKLLAGANCGGCGEAGCTAFAKAVVEGKQKVSNCPITSKENKEKIIELLGGGEIGESIIVVVACRGGVNCRDKYEYQGYGDCKSVELLAGGRKSCTKGCIGASTCINTCGFNAISLHNGYAKTNLKTCVKCGACIKECPKNLIKRIPSDAKIYIACSTTDKGKDVKNICTHGCIGCTLCAKNCTAGAINMVNNLPVLDYTKCNGCLTCVAKCPTKCIRRIV